MAIPVFQFGIFSDVDLSFFAGPNFDFGGRVHTNGNLFLAEGNGNTLTLRDKVTAVKEVVRQRLSNGVPSPRRPRPARSRSAGRGGSTGLRIATICGPDRRAASSTGSTARSTSRPGTRLAQHVQRLHPERPDRREGAQPAAHHGRRHQHRPGPAAAVDENVTNPMLFGERLLQPGEPADSALGHAADITNLPTVTATAPVQLDGNWIRTAAEQRLPRTPATGRSRRRVRRLRWPALSGRRLAGSASASPNLTMLRREHQRRSCRS